MMTMRCGIKWPSYLSTGALSALESCIYRKCVCLRRAHIRYPIYVLFFFPISSNESFERQCTVIIAREINAVTQRERTT